MLNIQVYWLGPCLGGTLAAVVYHYGFDSQTFGFDTREENNNDKATADVKLDALGNDWWHFYVVDIVLNLENSSGQK